MKLLIVTEVFYPENFIINDLATELHNRGHQVSVVTLQPSYPSGKVFPGYSNDKYSEEDWNGIKIYRFNTIEGYKTNKFLKIRKYLHFVNTGKRIVDRKCSDYDVIFVCQVGPLTVALPAIYAKSKHKVPVIVWTCDIWPDAVYMYGIPPVPPITWLVNHIIKKVYSNSDKVLVSSKNFTDTIKRYAPDKEIVYAPNWQMACEETTSAVRLSNDVINFTFTGNISKAQNLVNVIKGFASANLDNARLNIVGDGSYKDILLKEVNDNKIQNVIFYERQPYSEISDILSQSDFLILPLVSNSGIDKTEPFKIQSYLNSGKPILGILKGAGREIIEENELGICADPDDIEDIAHSFKQILKLNAEDKSLIAENAKMVLSIRYDRILTINQIETQLLNIIKYHE